MPEVRLAWRAAVCYGSPRGQVVIGISPVAEQCAAAEVFPPAALRRYPLPQIGDPGGDPPMAGGLGASGDIFGVVPLSGAGTDEQSPWDALLTLTIHGVPELAKFA